MHLSLIIPAYNEAKRIIPTLESVVEYLEAKAYQWEVIVVDDGSVDETSRLVDEWSADRVGVTVLPVTHKGKGWAVKQGMLTAEGDYAFMCDADMAMPIEWLDNFLTEMESGCDVVIGSRELPQSRRIGEPVQRHLRGRVFNWFVRLLAVSGFQDTQCGYKLFRRESALNLFRLQKIHGFGFDVEILYLAKRMSLSVREIPVDWYHRRSSKVRPGSDALLMLRDTLIVRLNDIRGVYDEDFEREG